ncbi:Hypothetical predicted protein [Podarcis lilfordi]|uniref:Uncharacterized protein n=1 Tax=Podarcis lilfordi TaxID=74358 RepID=A0AA35PJ52_9SAUR|nr:Hypothetical predicted protein [Podarcis lilfordi]
MSCDQEKVARKICRRRDTEIVVPRRVLEWLPCLDGFGGCPQHTRDPQPSSTRAAAVASPLGKPAGTREATSPGVSRARLKAVNGKLGERGGRPPRCPL